MNPLTTLLSLALLTTPPALAAPPTAKVVSPAESTHVGDPVRVEISLELAAGHHASFPEWGDTWGAAEIVDIGEVRSVARADGTRSVSQALTVVLFETGATTLPSPVIKLRTDAVPDEEPIALELAEPIVIAVSSLLPEGDEIPQPQPPASPRKLEWGTSYLWTSGLLGLACLVLLSLILRRRLATSTQPATAVDPLTALGAALDGLRSNPDLEEAFTALSLYLRRFLGETLSFAAAESTTTEIRLRLREHQLPPDLTKRTEQLLRTCDGVKFARQAISREEVEFGLGEAASIGAETIQAIAPPPAAEEESR